MTDGLNLNLIQMVQKARMQHDADAKPSQIDAVYWIEAKHEAAPLPTKSTSQWVINVPHDEVDAVWEQIKTATQEGKLGYKSKVSTAMREGKHRLCVRMEGDVQRVRDMLDTLYAGEWQYETD